MIVKKKEQRVKVGLSQAPAPLLRFKNGCLKNIGCSIETIEVKIKADILKTIFNGALYRILLHKKTSAFKTFQKHCNGAGASVVYGPILVIFTLKKKVLTNPLPSIRKKFVKAIRRKKIPKKS